MRKRRHETFPGLPLAADVLEVRSLLSAGAALTIQQVAQNAITAINKASSTTQTDLGNVHTKINAALQQGYSLGNPALTQELKALDTSTLTPTYNSLIQTVKDTATAGINSINATVKQVLAGQISYNSGVATINTTQAATVGNLQGQDTSGVQTLNGQLQQVQNDVANPPVVGSNFGYGGHVSGLIEDQAFNEANMQGTMTAKKDLLQVGSTFKASLNFSKVGQFGNGTIGKLTGSLTAQITDIEQDGDQYVVTMSPVTSALKMQVTVDGKLKTFTLSFAAAPVTLTLDSQGHLVSISGTFTLPAVPNVFDSEDILFNVNAIP